MPPTEDGLGYRPMLPRSERTRDSMAEPTANERTYDRVTVADAARLLGLSAEAVRMRIKRGTLASEKVGGTVYVLLDTNPTPSNADRTTDRTAETTTEQTSLIEVLRDQVAYLREQLDQEREANRENRRIIAGLVRHVPGLEAPPEPQESPETNSEGTVGGSPSESVTKRSWWRRLFGFE